MGFAASEKKSVSDGNPCNLNFRITVTIAQGT